MQNASIELQKPITGCMRPSSTMGIAVRKPRTPAITCMKPASIAGALITGGGMKTTTAGTPSATGAMRITNTIATAKALLARDNAIGERRIIRIGAPSAVAPKHALPEFAGVSWRFCRREAHFRIYGLELPF